MTQRALGEDTSSIQVRAPQTWAYLQRHRARLASRASAFFDRQPPFAVFGVGEYTFAPWKIVVSGLGKQLAFRCLGPQQGRPVVPDDTCYFWGFLPKSKLAPSATSCTPRPRRSFSGPSFWDAKRPITKAVLERLHLGRLAAWLQTGQKSSYESVDEPGERGGTVSA